MARRSGLASSDEGTTAVEYGIMVALIAIVIVTAVLAIGQQLGDDFDCAEALIRETPQTDPANIAC